MDSVSKAKAISAAAEVVGSSLSESIVNVNDCSDAKAQAEVRLPGCCRLAVVVWGFVGIWADEDVCVWKNRRQCLLLLKL